MKIEVARHGGKTTSFLSKSEPFGHETKTWSVTHLPVAGIWLPDRGT